MGAGGAITFLEGALKITNSVFQDLNARAGAGGPFARGGNGSLSTGVIVDQRNSDGQPGGNGGIASIPYSRDVSGVMAYSAPLIAGGTAGIRGGEFGLFEFPSASSLNGTNGGAMT